MSKTARPKKTLIKPIWGYALGFSIYWTLLVLGSFIFQVDQAKKNGQHSALNAARTAFQKDVTFRSWVADHGGVYVPVTDKTPSNPYLKVHNRDVTTLDGTKLTLLNPAYAFRQVVDKYQELYGIYGHLTSLKLLNPNNAPTPWEREALTQFEVNGIKEIWDLTRINKIPVLRMARPLKIKQACLSCHAGQGYALGDVRGAIVVTVPMKNYLTRQEQTTSTLQVTHLIFLGSGWLLIGLFSFALGRYLSRLVDSEEALKHHQDHLESEVQRRTLEAEEARRSAEEATAFKGEFLANMSHEIRTPLTGVLGVTSLLEKTDLSVAQQELLATIQYSGEHLLLIVNEVLDYSKLEAGEMKVDLSSVHLADLIESTLDMFALEAGQQRVQLLYILDSQCPETIQTDKKKLQQILINLISNSIKYTETGEIVIQVRPEQQKNNLTLFFSIQDTGLGIAEDDLGDLFNAFTQASQGAKPGTGLGLKISKQLVELLEGNISVTSQLNQGTTFDFSIKTSVGPKQQSLPEKLSASLHQKSLFVASDSQRFIEALESLLRPFGCPIARVKGPEDVRAESVTQHSVLLIDSELIVAPGSLWKDQWRQLGVPVVISAFLGHNLTFPEGTSILHKPLKAQALFHCLTHNKGTAADLDSRELEDPDTPRFDLKILLVEDHEINQMIGQKILDSLGYQCEVASDGKEAVKKALEGSFDVILMDIRMPVMGGLEATKIILEKMTAPHQPVIIAMTANVLDSDRESYLAAGMKEVLSKPLIPKELSTALTHWARERKKQRHIDLLGPNSGSTVLLNEQTVSSRIGLGGGFFSQLRAGFEESVQQMIQNLEIACQQGDDLKCIELSHYIKGLSENIGAELTAQICYQIEITANNSELDKLYDLISHLKEVFLETCKELQKVSD